MLQIRRSLRTNDDTCANMRTSSPDSYAFSLMILSIVCLSLCLSSPVAPSTSKNSAYPRIGNIIAHPPSSDNREKQDVVMRPGRQNSSAARQSNLHVPRQRTHLSPALAKRNLLSNSIVNGYRAVWKSYQVFVNSPEALDVQQNLYKQLEKGVENWMGNDSLAFTGFFIATYGAVELAFYGLPRNIGEARDFVLRFLVGVSEWIAGSLTAATYRLVIIAYDAAIQILLRIVGLPMEE